MKKSKKILAAFAAATMAMTMAMPTTFTAMGIGDSIVYADDAQEKNTQGRCGDNATYKYNAETKTLTISGTGMMWDDAGFVKGLNIKNIVINNGITVIGEYSFEGLTDLEAVSISGTVETIKKGAFSYVKGTVEIPSTVKKIEKNAFRGAKKYIIKGNVIGYETASLGSGIEEVIIGGTANDLGRALVDNEDKNVKIADTNVQCKILNGCIVSADGKSLYCCITDKSEITIPDTVEVIYPAAMYGKDITKLTLGKNVKTIGESAFENTWTKTLVVNSNLKTIGAHAFANCSFGTVKLKSKVNIGVGAFDREVKIVNTKKFKYSATSVYSAKLTKKKMKLRFSKVSGASGYQIRIKKGKKTYKYTTKKTTYTKTLPKKIYNNYDVKASYTIKDYDSNIKDNHINKISGAAYVSVRPYKKAKKKKAYGMWSSKIVLSK